VAWRKKSYPKMARSGSSNGRWIDGSSQTHYRNKTNAKPGQVVHHSDGNKKNNSRSNLKLISKAQHNKDHPEKGGNRKCKSGYVWSSKVKSCVSRKD
tara:strand:+ start:1914 stop:2204 length:291 start_codon:yes stop_codon:yes gene_type:complete